eukprot:GGOE01013847.1.p1 GENE.GGOE01013847.1~~GGOE01013847.1.p1  ORF type:complete len:244 (-),score=95.68 GGOE01013847.1:370-1101(-)
MDDAVSSSLNLTLDDHAQGEEDTLYEQVLRAWQNERHAPELLPYQTGRLEALMERLAWQQQQIDSGAVDKVEAEDLDLSLPGEDRRRTALGFPTSFLYQMDVDRVRFTIADYHRIRLEKVERYAHFLLFDEEGRRALSPAERRLAEGLIQLEAELFRANLLHQLPESLQSLTQEATDALPGHSRSIAPKPNLDLHVFCRAREAVGDFRASDDDSPITLDAGAIYFMVYRPLRQLICDDRVELV